MLRNAAWMLSLETGVFDNTERALLLYIPMGYTRLAAEKDEKNTYVVVAMSDTNRSDAIGTRQPLQDGEKIHPVALYPVRGLAAGCKLERTLRLRGKTDEEGGRG